MDSNVHTEAVNIIRDCQRILAEYLPPDGPDAKTTISRLLEILDGPRGLAFVKSD